MEVAFETAACLVSSGGPSGCVNTFPALTRPTCVEADMAIAHPIPVPILRQLLRLDPETGRLYWRERGLEWFIDGQQSALHACRRWNTQFAGKEAFTARTNGYLSGAIFNRLYYAQRVVFALANGYWPEVDTDHKDRDRANNRPENLRDATKRQNLLNGPVRGGSSEYRGVSWFRPKGKWRAYCSNDDGSFHHIGYFDDETDAARAFDEVAARRYGEFANLNFPA